MSKLREFVIATSSFLLSCSPGPTGPEKLPPIHPSGVASTAVIQPAPLIDGACELELAPVSEDARRAAPAYLVTRRGLVRVEPAGARLIKPVPRASEVEASVYTTPHYFAGPQGKLWMSRDDGLYVLGPTDSALRKVAPAVDGKWFWNLVVRSDSDIWALAIEGEVASRKSTTIAHFDGSTWQTNDATTLFGDAGPQQPFDMVATRDALWVSTAKGLWRGGIEGWQLVDPIAPSQIHASQDRVAGDVGGQLHVRNGSWQERFFLEKAEAGQIEAVGASGLLAWSGHRLGYRKLDRWPGGGLSSLHGTCRWRNGIAPNGEAVSFYWGTAIDGNNRVWVPGYNGFRVVNAQGRVLADYRAGMLEGLTSEVVSVVVPGGGPRSLPAPLPRRSLDIVGRLEIGKGGRGLAGATVEVAIGDGVVRTVTTSADGSFRLNAIPEGDYHFDVKPPASEQACPRETSRTGFDVWTASDCSPAKVVRGECNVGALQQCRQFTPPPMI